MYSPTTTTLLLLLSVYRALAASPDDLYTCLSSYSFRVITPSSGDYKAASAPYNTRLSIAPAALVYPSSAAEVSRAVLCAAESQVPVVARSGGHSYAGFSLGGSDGALVVDVSLLDKITFEGDGEIAVIETGNRLGDVAKKLFKEGRALPQGTCPPVGVGGHAGYGGFGFTSREWGLLLDRMVGAEVVLANGSIVTASEEENADLFWAIRGAVSSFGVVTYYKFRTLPVPPITTPYSYVFEGTPAQAASCFLAFQSYSATSAPAPLGMQFSVIPDLTFELFGSYTGRKADFEAAFLPLVKACETEHLTHAWAEEMGWMAYMVSQAGTPPRVSDCFYAKSLMTHEDMPLSYETTLAFFEYLYEEGPKHGELSWFVEVDVYGGVNSVINAVPPDATAFVHRDRLLGFQLYASSSNLRPPFPVTGFSFVDGMASALRSGNESATFGSYANYVDPLLGEEEWPLLYFGERYERLVRAKKMYDPEGVFMFAHAIGEHGPLTHERLGLAVPEPEGARRVVDEL